MLWHEVSKFYVAIKSHPLFVNYLLVIVGLEIENYLLMIDEFEIVVIAKLMELPNCFRLMKPICWSRLETMIFALRMIIES